MNINMKIRAKRSEMKKQFHTNYLGGIVSRLAISTGAGKRKRLHGHTDFVRVLSSVRYPCYIHHRFFRIPKYAWVSSRDNYAVNRRLGLPGKHWIYTGLFTIGTGWTLWKLGSVLIRTLRRWNHSKQIYKKISEASAHY